MAADDFSGDVTTTGKLEVGGSARGKLETSGDRDWFKVYLQAGTSYYFTLAGQAGGSDALRDPHLHLYDSGGEAITDNDDSGGKLDSRLVYTAPTSGYYYLAAGSYQDGQIGTYQIGVGSYANDYGSQSPGKLEPGQSLQGELQVLGDVDWVKVDLKAGTNYTITLQGTDSGQGTLADPYLYLYDSNAKVVTSDDDGSGRRDSVIHYTPSADGTFYLGLGSYQNASAGTYSVNLRAEEPKADDFTAGTDTTGRLDMGGSAQGELEKDGDRDWFAVDLVAGQTYYFDLQGSPTGKGTLGDSYLYLYDSKGNRVAFNDDGGQGFNSRLVFTADADGAYYLGAGGFDDKQTGTYTISAGKLPDGQKGGAGHITSYGVRDDSLDDGEHDWVSLNLDAATTYLIVLDSEGDEGWLDDPTLDLRDAGGRQIATGVTGDDAKRRTISFTTDQAGSYYIDVGSQGEHDSGRYLLSIVGRQTDEFNQAAGLGDWSAVNLFDTPVATLPGLSDQVVYDHQGEGVMAGDDGVSSARLTSAEGSATTGQLAGKV